MSSKLYAINIRWKAHAQIRGVHPQELHAPVPLFYLCWVNRGQERLN